MNDRLPPVYESRPYLVLRLPIEEGLSILHPEQVVATIGPRSFDFGAYCYARRSSAQRRGKYLNPVGRMVDLASFLPERVAPIRQAVCYFSDIVRDSGLSPFSIAGSVDSFHNFMEWSDASGHLLCLSGGKHTVAAYCAYAAHLEERFRQHSLTQNSAAVRQRTVCRILEGITGQNDLGKGLRLLRQTFKGNTGTEPAAEDDFASTLALASAIFKGLSTLVIETKPYPYSMPMPKSLGWEENNLWVFPNARWCLPPHLWGAAREKLDWPQWSIDFQHGKLAEPEQVWQHFVFISKRGIPETNGRRQAKVAIKASEMCITDANVDPRNHHRLRAAINAHNAFLLLFMAHTGLNMAVVRQLEWTGDIEPEAKQQGFREIKWRACGKFVHAKVRIKFLPQLRRFLELRNYLLNDATDYKYLFLSLGPACSAAPHQVGSGILHAQYLVLLKFDPKLSRIGPQRLRATVHDWYNRNVDPAVTARVHGHLEETVNRSYQAGSPVAHREEFSAFLDKVSETASRQQRVVARGTVLPEGIEGPLGTCGNPNVPMPIEDGVPIQPDCQHPDGCLFCQKHHIVADEGDTRKLASCAYVIQQTFYLPSTQAHFKPFLDMIDKRLNEIRAYEGCAEMVERVIRDVGENGNLDPYWSQKLMLLDSLEILQ